MLRLCLRRCLFCMLPMLDVFLSYPISMYTLAIYYFQYELSFFRAQRIVSFRLAGTSLPLPLLLPGVEWQRSIVTSLTCGGFPILFKRPAQRGRGLARRHGFSSLMHVLLARELS